MSTEVPACPGTCCQRSRSLGTRFTLRHEGLNAGGWHFKRLPRKAAQGITSGTWGCLQTREPSQWASTSTCVAFPQGEEAPLITGHFLSPEQFFSLPNTSYFPLLRTPKSLTRQTGRCAAEPHLHPLHLNLAFTQNLCCLGQGNLDRAQSPSPPGPAPSFPLTPAPCSPLSLQPVPISAMWS